LAARTTLAAGLLLSGIALAAAAPAAAQGGDGCLFREPRVTAQFRFGYEALMGPRSPGGDTDIFGFTQDLLTIDGGDHDALLVGGELGFRLTPRLDLTVDYSRSRSDVLSEFRDWVDNDDLPIQQTTTFTRQPLNFSLKYFLAERGQRVSRFAWVPRDLVPYVGAGGGFTWYEFDQTGDFVDFETFVVFRDQLRTTGRATTGHILAGAQYSLGPQFVLTGEGRYRFGSGELRDDFLGFDDMDLSGLHFTVGIGIRF